MLRYRDQALREVKGREGGMATPRASRAAGRGEQRGEQKGKQRQEQEGEQVIGAMNVLDVGHL